ncbi:MAG: carboxypeptidase-like regulatory domain-containing protein [Alphaproteobacteria bacterium]|nr:carboxypeptidase-like regulatory domain-containing protein [Alphaproteobacteria bacterium]
MKKLLSVLFAIIITLPALAMDVSITIIDENNEPLIGASVIVANTQNGVVTDTAGHATLRNIPDDSSIRISYVGYQEQTLPAQSTMSVKMEPTTLNLESVVVVACSRANGIKTTKCENCADPDKCTIDSCSGTCVVQECHEPCYKKKGNKCEMQSVTGGTFTFINNQCGLTCLSIAGYAQDPKNQWKCTQDCTSSITDPNVKKAQYKGSITPNNLKCEIIDCKGKYHPSDDKQSCIPDQGDCTPEQLQAVHATTGYLITRTNKCVPKECIQPQYRPDGKGDDRVCVDMVGTACNVKNATSAKFAVRDNKLICVVDTCDTANGYVKSADSLSCIKDCLSTIKEKVPLASAAEYDSTGKCVIKKCDKKNGKKYIPSDDGQDCEETERDCNKQTDSQIWPEHATAALYKKSKTGGTAKCVATDCEPGYKPVKGQCVNQVGQPCKVSHAKEAKFELRDNKLVCVVVSCDTAKGYTKTADGLECIKDCLSTAKNKEPLATKAEFDSNGKCIIKKCDKKDGKKYIPSDDGQKCEETERDCNKQTDSNIWPEHATAAAYKKSKTGGAAKCVATECEDGYDVEGGKCTSVNDSDCDKKPENSKKSHRYYDVSQQQTLCIIDECKDGYKISNDMLSCILESALSEEDAKKRMDELKENALKMKEKEQSIENKLLGAAGMATVGIGGMNIASALSEQSADRKAEDDMKAYLATFRCDYGQGRNILGGETNIQLPGASELMQYTTEYKQLALNLKSDKAALGMMPGIESETVFDSATTGLYDDVGIGTQKGAFTSLSRALLDENGADAAEWQAMKDATAKKLKTGVIVAGAGALGTLAGNLAINHGNGDQSANIMNQYEGLQEDIPDITLPRIPCSNFPDTTGVGYVPNCECKTPNSYFDEQTRKCEQCGTNEHVENKQCVCNDGFHRDANSGNCIANQPEQTCQNLPAGSGATGSGNFPNCDCKDQNATFDKQSLKCKCKDGFSNPNGGQCLQICAGLPGVDNSRASNYNVPQCPCEYDGAKFDPSQKACLCPQGQTPAIENGQKKCITPLTGTQCDTIPGATGTIVPNCTCTDPNKQFIKKQGKYGCHCKSGMREDESGNCVSGSDPVFSGNFSANETFDLGKSEISDNRCTQIINKIKTDSRYDANISGTLCISAIGHTDTKYFKNTPKKEAINKQKNQELSKDRAQAMHDCINRNIRSLFPRATVTSPNVVGKGWQECVVQDLDKDTPSCRRVEVKIQLNSCHN